MSPLMNPNVFLGDSKHCIPFRPSASQLLKRDEQAPNPSGPSLQISDLINAAVRALLVDRLSRSWRGLGPRRFMN